MASALPSAPRRLPLLSLIRPALGFSPLLPVNVASVVIVLRPTANSKIVPSLREAGAGIDRRAERLPWLSSIRLPKGRPHLCCVKGSERGNATAAGRQSEHRAYRRGASQLGGAVEIALAVLDHAAYGIPPILKLSLKEASVVMFLLPDANLNTVPSSKAPPTRRRAEEIALAVLDHAGLEEMPQLFLKKGASVVMLPLPDANSNTVPIAIKAAVVGCAEEIALGCPRSGCRRVPAAVAASEGSECGDAAAASWPA